MQRRNRAWQEGNIGAAWQENLILEKYYPPVLDTPSYVSRTGHRWPADQRADAERRVIEAGGPPRDYISDAYPYRLYTYSPAIHWMAAGIVVLLVSMPSLRRGPLRRRSAAASAVRPPQRSL